MKFNLRNSGSFPWKIDVIKKGFLKTLYLVKGYAIEPSSIPESRSVKYFNYPSLRKDTETKWLPVVNTFDDLRTDQLKSLNCWIVISKKYT